MEREIADRKSRLRRELKARRKRFTEPEWIRLSEAVRSELARVDVLRAARTVHAFWPIHENREVDIVPLLMDFIRDGKRIVLPVVDPNNPLVLTHHLFQDESHLKRSNLGILEPVDGLMVPMEELDAVLVPALSVDPRGTRLGYGAGHYDRFLSTVDIPRICPIFSSMMCPDLPREDHDIPMNLVVTENGRMNTL